MNLSLYEASVAVFLKGLGTFRAVLSKAEAFAAENKIDEAELLEARLAPDMLPLVRQIQILSDSAKAGSFRLGGQTAPSFADEETSLEALQDRLARTIQLLETIPADAINGREDAEVSFKIRDKAFHFTGRSYLNQFAMPNFYFHFVTAYAILRHKGVPLGKADFLGAIQG